MPIYHRLAQDDQGLRRTIADALVVLRTIPDFTDQSRADIRVQLLKLTSGELVGLIDLEFKGPLPQVTCIVSLATSSRFRAKWQGSEERHDRDVFKLDGALVDGTGNVTLADGPLLQSCRNRWRHLPPSKISATPGRRGTPTARLKSKPSGAMAI